MSPNPNAILDLIRLRPYTPKDSNASGSPRSSWYQSLSHPFRMGNAADIAYGGCAIAVLTAAAYQHIEAVHSPQPGADSGFAIYTATGEYLRPASTKSNFVASVEGLRSTRTFETVTVKVYQPVPGGEGEGKLNLCMFGTVDFMKRSEGGVDRSILTHTTQPRLSPTKGTLTHHTSLLSEPTAMQQRASRGEIPSAIVAAVEKTFGPMRTYTTSKLPPEGIWGPTAWGALKTAKVEQHNLPVPGRMGYDWLRVIGSLTDSDAQARSDDGTLPISPSSASSSLITFILDGALSFSPLSYTRRFLDDAAACASLDFAIRYHQEDNASIMDASKRGEEEGWLLREIRTMESRWERTYNEGVLFEEVGGKDGGGFRAVATMTQACVLKSRREREGKGKAKAKM